MSDAQSTQPNLPVFTPANTLKAGAGLTGVGTVVDYVSACVDVGHLAKPGYGMILLVVTVAGVPLHMLYNAAIARISAIKGATT